MVREYDPPLFTPGVPERVAVPLWLSVKLTPAGSLPETESCRVGLPVAVTRKVKGVPARAVVEFALMIIGVMAMDWLIVRLKAWVASDPTPLCAVRVKG